MLSPLPPKDFLYALNRIPPLVEYRLKLVSGFPVPPGGRSNITENLFCICGLEILTISVLQDSDVSLGRKAVSVHFEMLTRYD